MSNVQNYNDWAAEVPVSTRSSALLSYVTIAAFLAGFGYWAATAPLDGAAIAPGVVAASGKNQLIQHLEGGIVEKVMFREGDRVKAGDELIRLDQTLPQAQLRRLSNTAASLQARAARLEAERDGKETLNFPKNLATSANPEIADILREQKGEFDETLRRYKSELEILRQRQAALEESVVGLTAQKKAAEDQLKIVDEEIERKRKLLDKGLTDRSQFTALMRNQAELLGQIGQATAGIASANNQIIEARQQLDRAVTSRIETASKDLTETRRQLADVNEQVVAAEDVVKRVSIRAPSDGLIVKQAVNVPGGVVRPGEALIELLPTSDDLIIEGRLDPRDVDVVHIGQQARLRFVALNARSTPEVPGEVIYISPDRLVDQTTQAPYYSVRLKITGTLPDAIKPEQIYPGTPVESFISTEERTFLEYLVKPIQDSFQKAFREE